MGNTRSAFSLIELAAVLLVVGVLASASYAGLGMAIRNAKAVDCLNNLRQLGIASLNYASDQDGRLPQSSHQGPKKAWTVVLRSYLPPDVFRSPLDDTTRSASYAINDFVTESPYGAEDVNFSRLQAHSAPSETLLMAVVHRSQQNTDHFHFAESGYAPPAFEAEVWVDLINNSSHYLFVDGHVERLRWEEVQKELKRPDSAFVRPDRANPDFEK